MFDWTILKHAQNNTLSRPVARPEGGNAALGGPSDAAQGNPDDEGGVPRPVAITESQRRRCGAGGGRACVVPWGRGHARRGSSEATQQPSQPACAWL